jgi:YcxB-like protein
MTTPSNDTQEVVAECDWRFAEFARASRDADRYRARTLTQTAMRTGFTALVIGTLALAILDALTAEDTVAHLLDIVPWTFLIALWLVFRFGGNGWLAAWFIRQNNPNMLAGCRHAISRAGYRLRCGQAESQVAWAGIVRVVETRAFFLTFATRSGAYYLPKRVLNPEQCTYIRSLVQQGVGDRFMMLAA